MRGYELCLILHSDIGDDGMDTLAGTVERAITKHKGRMLGVDKWGKKNFKYTIKKQNKGHYCFIYFLGTNEVMREVDRAIRYHDHVLRYDIMRLPKTVDPESLAMSTAVPAADKTESEASPATEPATEPEAESAEAQE